MPVLRANIGYRKYGLSAYCLLYAQAELCTSGRSVVAPVKASDVVDWDGGLQRYIRQDARFGILQGHVVEAYARSKWNGSRIVVHIVPLDALVHNPVSTADDGLSCTGHVIGKPKPRSKVCPRVVDATVGNRVNTADSDAVQIELLTGEDRVRAGPECGTGGTNRLIARIQDSRIRGVIEARIEVGHLGVGFVGMGYSIPPQSKVQSEPIGHAEVVLNVQGPGNVIPVATALDGVFIVRLAIAKEIIGEVVSGVGTVEVEATLGILEPILNLLVQRPAAAHLELVPSFRPG